MSITSLPFILFIFALIVAYFTFPAKCQWILLLIFSLAFYTMVGASGILFLGITASTVYFAGRGIGAIIDRQAAYLAEHKASMSKEEKAAFKRNARRKRETILIVTIVVNIGILCAFKYLSFLLDQLNLVLTAVKLQPLSFEHHWIMPLGISFYTFQSIGYLADVYWGKCKAERNYFKFLLFVSFFPQITQGPISNFNDLSSQLFAAHRFHYEFFAHGFQRMLWGFLKKMVLADLLSPYVADVFRHYAAYSGLTVFIGALCYSVQIYADFSGYMDIMCGFCQILGIRLRENFDHPYFSKSVAEYWRRWHISLGDWFKNYVYYPIAISKWNMNLGKRTRKRFGPSIGGNVSATIALIVVWALTGLWHGASWGYIAWGALNGFFLILSMWMEPFYKKVKMALHIQDSNRVWGSFQVLRTFLLVTMIKVLPEVGTLRDGLGLWKQVFTNFSIPTSFAQLLPFVQEKRNLIPIVACTLSLLIVSLITRHKSVFSYTDKLPRMLRIFLLACIFMVIALFGITASRSGGFMYARF